MKTLESYSDAENPLVIIETPCEGHFVIRGYVANSKLTDDGWIAPARECYVSENVPTSALLAIIAEREKLSSAVDATGDDSGQKSPAPVLSTAGDLLSRVLAELEKDPKRLSELVTILGVSEDDIRALDGVKVVSGGWVKKTEVAE